MSDRNPRCSVLLQQLSAFQGTATFLCQMYAVLCFTFNEKLINETLLDIFCVESTSVGKSLIVPVSNVLTVLWLVSWSKVLAHCSLRSMLWQ